MKIGTVGLVFAQLSHFNSKTAAPIFTKFLNDGEALVSLLMHSFTKQCCILCRNFKSDSKGSQFPRFKDRPQN